MSMPPNYGKEITVRSLAASVFDPYDNPCGCVGEHSVAFWIEQALKLLGVDVFAGRVKLSSIRRRRTKS